MDEIPTMSVDPCKVANLLCDPEGDRIKGLPNARKTFLVFLRKILHFQSEEKQELVLDWMFQFSSRLEEDMHAACMFLLPFDFDYTAWNRAIDENNLSMSKHIPEVMRTWIAAYSLLVWTDEHWTWSQTPLMPLLEAWIYKPPTPLEMKDPHYVGLHIADVLRSVLYLSTLDNYALFEMFHRAPKFKFSTLFQRCYGPCVTYQEPSEGLYHFREIEIVDDGLNQIDMIVDE